MDVVTARILYWGIEGAGKRTNLNAIHGKLRPDNRGELEYHRTRIDPSVSHVELPIELGNLGGVSTSLRLVAPPGTPEHKPTRAQLLDQVDGVVFVVDTQRERLDENLQALEELRGLLQEYGRSLDDVPLVFQYNKRDLSDPYAMEELHRKFDLSDAAAFEAVATEGTGVLQTLTTISKRVVRHLRSRPPVEAPAEPATPEPATPEPLMPEPVVEPTAAAAPAAETQRIDPAPTEGLAPELLLTEVEGEESDPLLDTTNLAEAAFEDSFQEATEQPAPAAGSPFEDLTEVHLDEAPPEAPPVATLPASQLQIVRAGEPQVEGPQELRLPLVLRDDQGREHSLTLSLRLDLGRGD